MNTPIRSQRDISDSSIRSLEDMITERFTRRSALKGLAVAAMGAAVSPTASATQAAESQPPTGLTFREVPHGADTLAHVPPGYELNVVMRWGDPVAADAPPFDPNQQSVAAQEKQFGYNNDFVAFLSLPWGNPQADRGLLVVNHEYANGELMFPGLQYTTRVAHITQEQAEIELAACGMSIVEIRNTAGAWAPVAGSRYNRRISALSTPVTVSGPAAGHARLQTAADPTGKHVLGTLNNCSGGVTPWGTVISGEENFQEYFSGEATGAEAENHRRFGVGSRVEYGYSRFQPRFQADQEPHEPNRFGWIVEVDPFDPQSQPIKRTALGRMCHEGGNVSIAPDGRVVVYMGDDSRFEYLYKFVSSKPYDPNRRSANRDLLDDGTLYVARFESDGRLLWMPLIFGQGPLTAEHGFNSQADVLIETRRAADLLGATPMDRPEDVEENPVNGKVYVALTNNTKRGDEQIDQANPRPANAHGHVIELTMPDRSGRADHAATECRWDIFLMGGDPAAKENAGRYNAAVSNDGWLSCPDNVAFDPAGRLWISTDGASKADGAGFADGLFACETSGPGRALTREFFVAPLGAEVCGPCFTPDGKTLFVAVQHPGEGSTLDNPSTRWPDFKSNMPPRPSVIAITRKDQLPVGK